MCAKDVMQTKINNFLAAIIFFASPLSTIAQVVQTKNSSSIDPPVVITALVNTTLWTIYGIWGTGDPTVIGPNATGMVLQLISISFMLLFPRKEARLSTREGGSSSEPSLELSFDAGEKNKMSV